MSSFSPNYSLCPQCFGLIPRRERVCHICAFERWPNPVSKAPVILARILWLAFIALLLIKLLHK